MGFRGLLFEGLGFGGPSGISGGFRDSGLRGLRV